MNHHGCDQARKARGAGTRMRASGNGWPRRQSRMIRNGLIVAQAGGGWRKFMSGPGANAPNPDASADGLMRILAGFERSAQAFSAVPADSEVQIA